MNDDERVLVELRLYLMLVIRLHAYERVLVELLLYMML
jgi:hypothetical protein